REILGCEEGVNVVVINDELCLEYDFDELRPVVTVDPFFTKVMKAHQYEGVKFMWDACFESVSQVQSGHAGGGCILAHCMGLGKTLQVLALLHTVRMTSS
ncbi:jg207, partial [Pararge aegeria aegeria]